MQYPTDTMTNKNYADDPALFTNTPVQAESLQHSLSQTKYMCFGQKRGCLLFKWQASKIRRPDHISQQQHLIYWKIYQQIASKGMECNWHQSYELVLIHETNVISLLPYPLSLPN